MQRRILSSLAVLLAGCTVSGSVSAQFNEDENHLTHGPILGRLSAHGIGVWARARRTAPFTVRYGTSPEKLDQETQPVATRLAHDNTGWVHITGLKADTKYWYRLMIRGQETGRGGSFRTLPDAKELRDAKYNPQGLFNFSFEFACGNNQNATRSNGPSLPTFETMLRKRLQDEIHFAILNGDWLYETQRDYTVEQWNGQTRNDGELPLHLQAAPNMVGVWQNYKTFLDQAPKLTEWHSQVPSFFTYDDHECLNDIWGAGTPGLRDRRAVFRDIGVRAWYDYLGWANPTKFTQPVHFGRGTAKAGGDVLVDSAADFTRLDLAQSNNLHVHWGGPTSAVNDNALDGVGGDPNAGVYRIEKVLGKNQIQVWPAFDVDGEMSYSLGRRSYFRMRIANCDFFVCDTRGQRQMHDKSDPYKKGISMLGPVQKKWLLDGMRKSTAEFLFVVSSVNFMIPHVGGGAVRTNNKDDAWTVFFDERESLIHAWDQIDKPVLILTGDLHNSFVIRVTDNVWECASGPHNSGNHHNGDEGDRPANGPFKYGPREVDIRWSTWYLNDIPRAALRHPTYCVVQVNNVFNNPLTTDGTRWMAFPRPQVIFQYYDGKSGRLQYAESVLATPGQR
ncbi:MAG: alkaline phosphatase D family protein [Planctomycetaceae bacterium]